ncbi:MAG: hypothetical protein ACYDDF_03810 [Thermoplasmatota archaeon]
MRPKRSAGTTRERRRRTIALPLKSPEELGSWTIVAKKAGVSSVGRWAYSAIAAHLEDRARLDDALARWKMRAHEAE